MSTVLITGASGFIGQALCRAMAATHEVIGLSRQPVSAPGVRWIQGDFADPEHLPKLDGFAVDALVHLAAVTGGCREEDGLRVNVSGTHHLLRYLIDRGCPKFVLASSIAAVGFQNVCFRPLQLPMADEHPCLDRDGYGLSKYLMEELSRYLARQNEGIDILNLRLASIVPDERSPEPVGPGPLTEWAIGRVTLMGLADTVRCLHLAVDAPLKPGVRILNATAPQACVAVPIQELLRSWYGDSLGELDLSHYQRPGHERDALYDVSGVERELGFVAQRRFTGEA